MLSLSVLTLATSLAGSLASAAPGTTTVDFANGTEGWQGLPPAWADRLAHRPPRQLFFLLSDGQSGHVLSDSITTTNHAFLGDYTQPGSVTLGIDVLASAITYEGREVPRQLVMQLIDHDSTEPEAPYAGVWYDLGRIQAGTGWQHLSVTIGDRSAAALPAGCGGDGATVGGSPGLPDGRTFASVLANVDEVRFTTAVPGYLSGYTYYAVSIDNISIAAVPGPAAYAAERPGPRGCLGSPPRAASALRSRSRSAGVRA